MMARKIDRGTIIVVEDEAEVRNFVSRVLELEGYGVLQAENGEKGLELVQENRGVDLVLLDLKMPGIDGWTLLSKIKSDPELAAIPVIVFTASAGSSEKQKALGMGATEYLVKPQRAMILSKVVGHILTKKTRGQYATA